MSEAITAEQPMLFPDMPAESKVLHAVRQGHDEASRWREDSEREGGLMTRAMAAAVLGISRERVWQLCQAGRFVQYRHFDKNWLSTRDIMAFFHQERKSGRPPKVPKTWPVLKAVWHSATGKDDDK